MMPHPSRISGGPGSHVSDGDTLVFWAQPDSGGDMPSGHDIAEFLPRPTDRLYEPLLRRRPFCRDLNSRHVIREGLTDCKSYPRRTNWEREN